MEKRKQKIDMLGRIRTTYVPTEFLHGGKNASSSLVTKIIRSLLLYGLLTVDLVFAYFYVPYAYIYQFAFVSVTVKLLFLLTPFVFQKQSVKEQQHDPEGKNILIVNWRDTKHVYAGGAEVYIHELAKRWVKEGNTVTQFCGNDRHNKAHETIDGVQIIRRGGTYTVYFFAVLHYLFAFAKKYDVVIDCENGIPFFTPLYSRIPVVLLIHHVHQEVFRVFLRFPLNHIAAFLEGKVMPRIYKDKAVITVSESSKREIINLGFTKEDTIEVIPNGVSEHLQPFYQKTEHPSFIYLGRLKDYKNIDIAIHAFAHVVKQNSTATFVIAGSGESYPKLKALVARLQLQDHVIFFGKVKEEEKTKLLSASWVAVQPSQIEGWGITVIEANATGTPVIASRVSGLQDSVIDGKTGILAEVGNIKQFATAMILFMTDVRLRTQMSERAYLWSKQFNWSKSADAFYQLIEDSIEKKKSIAPYVDISLSGARK